MDCVFCKIVEGQIPSTTIFEDNDFKVILDISPANLGHSLVICKHHYENLIEMPEELVGKGFIVAKKVAKAIKEATNCDGINILQNNGVVAGQTVFHFHIHIIPRLEKDSVKIDFGDFKTESEKIIEIGEKIKNYFSVKSLTIWLILSLL